MFESCPAFDKNSALDESQWSNFIAFAASVKGKRFEGLTSLKLTLQGSWTGAEAES